MASEMEAELGGLFEHSQKATSMKTTLTDMGQPQPQMAMETDNTEANSIVNGTENKIKSRAIDIIFYWVRDRI